MTTWVYTGTAKAGAAATEFFLNEIKVLQRTVDAKTINKLSGNPAYFMAPGRAKFLRKIGQPGRYWAYAVGGLAHAYEREKYLEKQKKVFADRLKNEDF